MANQRKRSEDETAQGGGAGPAEGAAIDAAGAKFEDQLESLEAIVTRIDSGELSLEESIAAFESGVGLVRSLNHKLDEVERRVEVLMRSAGGELKRASFEEESGVPDHGGTKKNADDDEVPF